MGEDRLGDNNVSVEGSLRKVCDVTLNKNEYVLVADPEAGSGLPWQDNQDTYASKRRRKYHVWAVMHAK